MPSAAAAGSEKWFIDLDEYKFLLRARREHAVAVTEPLVLISQVQRSGGSLLSQLFDGHPECHAHPHELKIGYPDKSNWPPLDLAAPDDWFPMLFEREPGKYLKWGYHKSPSIDRFPFVFLPKLQRAIFEDCVGARSVRRERDVLDCYLTSFFNAWLDNHNLYTGPKKIVSGFVPRLAMELDNVQSFFSAYPDGGTLISIVRDPRAWYASAKPHGRKYGDLEASIAVWRRSAEAAIEAKERFGDPVLILAFERLVLETEATMTIVADRVGVTMSPVLLAPTFNGRPIRANSSRRAEDYGVLGDRANSHRDVLDDETLARIESLAGDAYERAAGLHGA